MNGRLLGGGNLKLLVSALAGTYDALQTEELRTLLEKENYSYFTEHSLIFFHTLSLLSSSQPSSIISGATCNYYLHHNLNLDLNN